MENFFVWFEKLANIILDMVAQTKAWFESGIIDDAKKEW